MAKQGQWIRYNDRQGRPWHSGAAAVKGKWLADVTGALPDANGKLKQVQLYGKADPGSDGEVALRTATGLPGLARWYDSEGEAKAVAKAMAQAILDQGGDVLMYGADDLMHQTPETKVAACRARGKVQAVGPVGDLMGKIMIVARCWDDDAMVHLTQSDGGRYWYSTGTADAKLYHRQDVSGIDRGKVWLREVMARDGKHVSEIAAVPARLLVSARSWSCQQQINYDEAMHRLY